MPTTSNDRIADGFIRRQINLQKRYRGIVDELVRILNRGEPRLRRIVKSAVRRIRQRPSRQATIIADLRVQLRDAIADDWKLYGRTLRADLDALMRDEVAFSRAMIEGNLPVTILLATVKSQDLRKLRGNFPIEGRTLAQWLAQARQNDLRRITDSTIAGIVQRETPVQVGRRVFGSERLRGTDGVRSATRNGTQALVNTVAAGLILEARRQLWADSNLIDEELYVAVLDSRTTVVCSTLDGNRYPTNEGPRPPIHFNCRSIRVPIVPGAKLGRRPINRVSRDGRELAGLRGPARRRRAAELVGQAPAELKYTEFFERQSASFQDSVLGPTRGRLYRRGQLPLERFIDETGERLTLRELYERERAAFNRAGIPPPPPPD